MSGREREEGLSSRFCPFCKVNWDTLWEGLEKGSQRIKLEVIALVQMCPSCREEFRKIEDEKL